MGFLKEVFAHSQPLPPRGGRDAGSLSLRVTGSSAADVPAGGKEHATLTSRVIREGSGKDLS